MNRSSDPLGVGPVIREEAALVRGRRVSSVESAPGAILDPAPPVDRRLPLSLVELVGWYGAVALITAYLMVSFSLVDAESLTYQILTNGSFNRSRST
jgi:hypothetical protein